MNVRPMMAADAEQTAAVDAACFSDAWTKAGLEYEAQNPRGRFYVACDSDVIVGYLGAWRILDECDVARVAVLPRARRAGTATALLSELFFSAEAEGVKTYTLEVRTSNAPAIALYKKYGFRSVGIHPRYYADGEDALIMKRGGEKHEEEPR